MTNYHLPDDEWWAQYGLMELDGRGKSTTPEEVQALREFMEGNITPTEAARRLMDLSEDRIPADGPWDKGERIGWLMYDVAVKWTEKQPLILDLCDAIHAMEELDMTDGQRIRFKGIWIHWRNLDDFYQICESLYEKEKETAFESEHGWGPGSSWVRVNTTVANYCLRYRPCHSHLSHCGFLTIVETLEQDPWNLKDWRRMMHPITILNVAIFGLVPWFQIAGRLLYNFTDDWPTSTMSDIVVGSRMGPKFKDANLWHGPPRFSKERWAFWKERLRYISELREELLEETCDTATMLVETMDEIENDPQTEKWTGWVQEKVRRDNIRWNMNLG